MGCDIHLVLERKNDAGKWVGLSTFSYLPIQALEEIGPHLGPDEKPEFEQTTRWRFWRINSRNYNLFGRLAGVRTQGPEPRGIPDDISDLARMEIDDWGGDGHSHSWGLLSEIGGLFLAVYDASEILGPGRVEQMMALFGLDNTHPPEEYRLVYFFDN